MTPTKEILQTAPKIIACYGLSFMFLPLNIFLTYCFQAILKLEASFIVSISRGLVISGIFCFLLPIINVNYLWFTMPLTEIIVAIFAFIVMTNYTRKLPVRVKEI